MDPKITQEILDDLIPSLEALEAKSSAVLEFLKREGIAGDEKLAPYLEQATSASNVRWLGVRVRIERLLSAAEKDSARKQADAEKESRKNSTNKEDKMPPAAEKNSLQPETAKSESEEKSSRPESSEEKPSKDKAEKNKDAETARKPAETKSGDSTNQNDKNGDRARTGERDSTSTVSTGTDQKVA
jgi:hypothetical protein